MRAHRATVETKVCHSLDSRRAHGQADPLKPHPSPVDDLGMGRGHFISSRALTLRLPTAQTAVHTPIRISHPCPQGILVLLVQLDTPRVHLGPNLLEQRHDPPASSIRTITTPRISRTCGISSRSPFPAQDI